MRSNQIMFKMLFRPDLYSFDQVKKMMEKNPDILWVVYQVRTDVHENLGTMDARTVLAKFG